MMQGDVPVYGGNGVNGRHSNWNVEIPTIVVGRVGVHCGNVHVSEPKSWITDNAIYATRFPSFAALNFLAICLLSARLGNLSQGGAQPFVNQKALNEVPIPLPSFEEQTVITDRLDMEYSRLDTVVSSVTLERQRVAALKQGILRHAFSGRLAPQNSGDEPAAVLLARIATDRATPSITPLKRGRKPRSLITPESGNP